MNSHAWYHLKLLTNILVMKLKSKDVQKQSLWLLVLFAVFFAAVVFNSDWKTDVHEHLDSNTMFKYHKPESTLKNAINHYTVIHFLQYTMD